MKCLWCDKYVLPNRFPYGVSWLCGCGHWVVRFDIDGKLMELCNGDEELAIQYFGKVAEILEMK
jgi:hypothetical protein